MPSLSLLFFSGSNFTKNILSLYNCLLLGIQITQAKNIFGQIKESDITLSELIWNLWVVRDNDLSSALCCQTFNSLSYENTLPRHSKIIKKNWSTSAKSFLTFHLWYKAALKVWKKILELPTNKHSQSDHNLSNWAGLAVLDSW